MQYNIININIANVNCESKLTIAYINCLTLFRHFYNRVKESNEYIYEVVCDYYYFI